MKGPRPSPSPWIGTIAVAVSLLALLPYLAMAATAEADLLPDLIAPAPTSPRAGIESLGDGRNHLLLRFNGYIHNAGPGPLEIRGSRPVDGAMTTTGQRIYREDSSYYDDNSRHPTIHYETTDGHNHWHVMDAARYSLWNEGGTTEVAPGAKVGFCLQDVERVDGFGPRNPVYSSGATGYCREGQPNASQVFEGISSGWQDDYIAKLPFQWVDLSDVAPGQYRLGAQVDPDDFVRESNEADNGPTLAGELVTVPGYAAMSGKVAVSQAQTITLGATPYGAPGPRVLTIESAPRHGSLSSPAGAPLPAPQTVYTPKAGFSGSDTFTYSARDASSPYPIHSPVASVTIAVSGKKVKRSSKLRLLTRVRFLRHGRFLLVRARARKTGVLRVAIVKRRRHLGSCHRAARSGHRFACRIKLRRHTSPAGAKAIVRLRVRGQTAATNTFRVPHRLRRV
jgi:lysyl oxidase/Big-like domain-containing protein